MPHLETKRRRPGSAARRPAKSRRKPENLVAEIVDQISQARAVEIEPEASRRRAVPRDLAGTPYQAVLGCANEEPESS